ncbi:MAG: Tat pathway signal protein, partial [bacterium]
RIVYLAADIDRCYGRDNLPDHRRLLINLIRWAVKDNIPLRVEGKGLIDCHLYRQNHRLILSLVNLTNPEAWRGPVYELIPVGPIKISIKPSLDFIPKTIYASVSKSNLIPKFNGEWITFNIPSILDHELIVIS